MSWRWLRHGDDSVGVAPRREPRALRSIAAMDVLEHEELLQRLADPELVLLDVLPRKVYERGHLPNARCLPIEEIDARAADLIDDGDLVVVYCVNAH